MAEKPPMKAELQVLFRKLKAPLSRLLYLADRSFVDHAAMLGDVTGPDAELIRECSRLFCIQVAINTAHEEIPHEAARQIVMKPIHDQWYAVRNRLVKLGGPQTLEGAQGAALVLLDQHPEGLDGQGGATRRQDQRTWLAIHCAQFLLSMGARQDAP